MPILSNAHLLRHFLAVVTDGTLTGAAGKIAVTQPALSKSIRKLERELGVPLFERLPRGIALTAYGKTLLPHAQRIVSECRLADLELQAFGSGHKGLLRVGAGLMFGATFVPAAIADLYAMYPGIAFQLTSAVTEVNFPLLCAGELDLIFGLLPAAATIPDYLTARPLLDLTSRVVAGANHPLMRRRTVRAADLVQWPWVVIQHDRELVNTILATLTAEVASESSRSGATLGKRDRLARHPTIAVEVSSLSSLVRLLQSGCYLSCFGEPLAAMPDLGLALVPYARGLLQGPAGVVYHRSLERYGPANALIQYVEAAVREKRV